MVSKPKADKLMLDEETLTVKELAGRLKWHERSVRRLVQQGKLPARLVGTQLRFLWSEVVASLPLAPATASGRASVPGVVALDVPTRLRLKATHFYRNSRSEQPGGAA